MVKVAFVGCGEIQQVHYERLARMDDVKMVGHCDVEKPRAEAAANRYGGDAFSDPRALYDKARPHAVYVAVPPYAHEGIEEAAAERGIHLFIEKPVALNRTAAQRIAVALRNADIVTSVAYCYRYYDTVAIARQFLKGKAVSLVTGSWQGAMREVWWWRRMDKSGGQIMEQTTHLIDLARYLCGDVAEVHATASTGCMTKVDGYDVHDSSVVSLRFKNGAAGAITSSCVANHADRISLEVVTPEATVTLRGGRLIIQEDGRTTEYTPKVDMYTEESAAFIDAVQSGKKNRVRSSYTDGLRTFLVTCAANESIECGMPVRP